MSFYNPLSPELSMMEHNLHRAIERETDKAILGIVKSRNWENLSNDLQTVLDCNDAMHLAMSEIVQGRSV